VSDPTPSNGNGHPTSTSTSTSTSTGSCPFLHGPREHDTVGSSANKRWWPNSLNLSVLHQDHNLTDPNDDGFDYADEFAKLDLDAVKKDVTEVMTTSQDWWPADYGHYGPLFIRMAWHSAGTYRVADGRGGSGAGMLRFAPLNSWPDNVNLDKSRRLLWPVKKKYGRSLSWADLMVLAGNCAIEDMGLPTFGFAGGREDRWQPEEDVYWGPEDEWLGDSRYTGERDLENPLGAVQMGLIYVNPEGPNGNPDPVAAAHDIRETFGRMAMDDEETVALIAGGHTFGKAHGAGNPDQYVGAEPEGAELELQGLGWKNTFEGGHSAQTITSGLEGAWTSEPTKWNNEYFENLFKYEWKQVKSPAGATQWEPTSPLEEDLVPDAHDPEQKHPPIMFTTDLSLRMDPAYEKISRRFLQEPEAFSDAFARAWYKLTHRDMGPHSRLLGPEVPEPQLWQDPTPDADHELIGDSQIATLKQRLLSSGLSISQLVFTAWSAAASYRDTDKRGGANGGRLRLSPQKDWAVNDPEALQQVLPVYEKLAETFNSEQSGNVRVSLAELYVLGGCAAVEAAAKQGGHEVSVPFTPGRTDATQDMTDAEAMAVLEPTADGFRNYIHPEHQMPAAELLIDRAQMLKLTAPEMTIAVGGLRVLGANTGQTKLGVFTDRVGTLSNDFFVNLLAMDLRWQKSERCGHFYEGKHIDTGEVRWMGTAVDLVFGSNSQLRALAEFYASDDAEAVFAHDFAEVFGKVMALDRFDLKR
jgi:catalase-peroxidase